MSYVDAIGHTIRQLELMAAAAERHEARMNLRRLECLVAVRAAANGKDKALRDLEHELTKIINA